MLASPSSDEIRQLKKAVAIMTGAEIKNAEKLSDEQVKKIALLDREFSQAAGELTPTLKAKRSIIAQRHAALLQELYQSPGS